MHVGDVEDPAIGGELDVLGHAGASVGEIEHADDTLSAHVELDHLPGELATRDQVAPVGREVHVIDADAWNLNGAVEREGMRIAEVEPAQPLGDDDRVAPAGRA
jgi:hypothetical protein